MTSHDEILAQDAARDIMAARAEIAGRRDQVIAEYDERLAALESGLRGASPHLIDRVAIRHFDSPSRFLASFSAFSFSIAARTSASQGTGSSFAGSCGGASVRLGSFT